MADVQLYGLDPRWHHLTNVAVHALSATLLMLLLYRLTGSLWQGAFIAALFALHPLHVESVAWVAERKDVLSAFFGFLTLLLYSEYRVRQNPVFYEFALYSFILGLMSKPMLVTMPLVMLLMDLYPLDPSRHGVRECTGLFALVKEKISFFACALLSCAITVYAQYRGGAVVGLNVMPFQLRFENAVVAYMRYIGKTLYPHDLALLYPLQPSFPLWQVAGSSLALIAISLAAVGFRRRCPYLAFGWFWFLVTLVPVIGIVQVGSQSMADRYSYIPITGLFVIAACGTADLTKRMRHREIALALVAGIILIAFTMATRRQIRYWRDSATLYQHTLQVTSDNYMLHYNFGNFHSDNGDINSAIFEYREALLIRPGFVNARNNLGIALGRQGDLDAAIITFKEAIRDDPGFTDAYLNLGVALGKKGDIDAAIQVYREGIRTNPNNITAQHMLDNALAQKNDSERSRDKLKNH
ncbi:MAG: tetratricopeptide repeat protein [Oryzomonas sp.]|uniref:tetratricopeptide repeat protein n=1 Tax=Oryzomonas sp. TaxID=2855186 RepID=UPI00284693F0|nr:tetratricopeptide repeat protein [Oryzomonas sp.]MDR3579630.1 tetratricopeptide repeat protein [Oryzomonas sp.]